jgi:hypothetical protein
MADRVVRNYGPPDVLVNSAGAGAYRFLDEMTVKKLYENADAQRESMKA